MQNGLRHGAKGVMMAIGLIQVTWRRCVQLGTSPYLVLLVSVIMLDPVPAHCKKETYWPKTKQEFAALPDYCAARMHHYWNVSGASQADWDREEKRLGRQNFMAIHHYCAALNILNRADKGYYSSSGLVGAYEAVVMQIDYVLRFVSRDFLLYGELLVTKGDMLGRLGRKSEASQLLLSGIRAAPREARGYSVLADIYVALDECEQAKKVVSVGLRNCDGAPELKARLEELEKRGCGK